MTYQIVQKTRVVQATNVALWSATFPNTTTSGNLLVAMAFARDSLFNVMTGLPMSDVGTNAWISGSEQNLPPTFNFNRVGLSYVPNCVGKASHVVTVTPSTTAAFLGAGDLAIFEISNIVVPGSFIVANPQTGTTAAAQAAGIVANSSGITLAALGFWDNAGAETITPGIGNGFNTLFDPAAASGTHISFANAGAGAMALPNWTFSTAPNNGWVALELSFNDSNFKTVYQPVEMSS